MKLTEVQTARAGIGRTFQHLTVLEDQSVIENLTLALKAARSPWRVLAWKAVATDNARILQLAAQVGLTTHLARKADELSLGQKQWLEIAMPLAQEPLLLLDDEPAAGMTPAERDRMTELLVEIANIRAVVVREHNIEFVRRLNFKVTVLHEGAVLTEGSLNHVPKNQDVIEVNPGRGE